jgi:AcrR family transcriptional regulator
MRAIASREDVRQSILDAADRLLARYGYKKMTVEDLAQEVGIGKGSVYLHFPSKEEVVLSHVDRIVDRLKIRLRSIASEPTPPAERLRRMLVERVLFRFDNVQHYTESLSDLLAALRPGLLARRERHFEEEAELLDEVLREGRRGGTFAFENSMATARTLILATNCLLPYSLSTRELGKREDVKEQASRIIDLLLNGLVARHAGGAKPRSMFSRRSK